MLIFIPIFKPPIFRYNYRKKNTMIRFFNQYLLFKKDKNRYRILLQYSARQIKRKSVKSAYLFRQRRTFEKT